MAYLDCFLWYFNVLLYSFCRYIEIFVGPFFFFSKTNILYKNQKGVNAVYKIYGGDTLLLHRYKVNVFMVLNELWITANLSNTTSSKMAFFCPKMAIWKILGGLHSPSAPWAVQMNVKIVFCFICKMFCSLIDLEIIAELISMTITLMAAILCCQFDIFVSGWV